MDKNEFVEKNRSFVKRMMEKYDILMKLAIIPKFIGVVITARKIASMFGYTSLVLFLKDACKDDDKLVKMFESFDEEKQNKLSELYNNVFITQYDDLESDFNEVEKVIDQAELSENVLESLGESSDDDDDDDGIFAGIKNYIINKFFDGVDPIEEIDDDDNE